MKKSTSLLLILLSFIALSACTTQVLRTSEAMTDDDPLMGQADAALTMVVFSDFECPYCADYFQTIEDLREDWIDTGKLKIQYRDFPLASHLNSLSAHAAANAAHRQEAYFEMHAKLFEERDRWVYTINPDQTFLEMAQELGLDEEQFAEDYNDEALLEEIRADRDAGRELGVAGTPATFINDERYQGALSYEDLITELTTLSDQP